MLTTVQLQVRPAKDNHHHFANMMSATHLPPFEVSGPAKEDSSIGSDAQIGENSTTEVTSPNPPGPHLINFTAKEHSEEKIQQRHDGQSSKTSGPTLIFSDMASKSNINIFNSSAKSVPDIDHTSASKSTVPPPEHSAPIFNPEMLREIFPVELPRRPTAPKSSFFSRIFKRSKEQPEDIELGRVTSPRRKSSRYTLLPVKCHRSFLVGGWVFLVSCGAIVYWSVSQELNKNGSTGTDDQTDVVTQATAAAMLKL